MQKLRAKTYLLYFVFRLLKMTKQCQTHSYAVQNFTEAFKGNILRLYVETRCSFRISTRTAVYIFVPCYAGVAVLLKENARRVNIRKNRGEREMMAEIKVREIFCPRQKTFSTENILYRRIKRI